MCGIIGAITKNNVSQILLDGLKRLEYRGYDSAGIAVIDSDRHLQRLRTAGKVQELQNLLNTKSLHGKTGIGHTRWATHGKPSVQNAHPHIAADSIALVHNGIIENHVALRARLRGEGCKITSETDSELIAHLVHSKIKAGANFLAAVRAIRDEIEGAYAIGFIHNKEPDRIIAIRSGSPLVIGLGTEENFIASDILALLPLTQRFIYLEEGDIADVRRNDVIIYAENGEKINRPVHVTHTSLETAKKGDFEHFMLKEIFEQSSAALSTLQGRIVSDHVLVDSFGVNAREIFRQIHRVQIVACGTSYHAALIGKQWLEEIGGIPCQAEIASEYRYRRKVVEPDTLFVTLSQSGETADTLAALRIAKRSGYAATLAICNVPESSIVRESDLVLMMSAGLEIGVASTKSFTCQLVAMILLSLSLGRFHHLSKTSEAEYVRKLYTLPEKINATLKLGPAIKELAKTLADKNNAIFIGRGNEYAVAMEGALKLKEISYIHAEAYPAGELKHGPLALVDANMTVIALAPKDELTNKLKSNFEEVRSRGGKLIIFADERIEFENKTDMQIVRVPHVDALLTPIIYSIPLQFLAYYVAIFKGTDIDQPRNLAKSVTVE